MTTIVYDHENKQIAIDGRLTKGGSTIISDMDDGYFCKMLIDHNECKGSGELLALAALDHGESALNAINYAMTRDMFTGGKVNVYDIEKGEFI